MKIELAEIANNGEATMNVVFSADEDFICFQTEVVLPDGMEAVMTDSRYAFLPDGIRATHQISSNLVGNILKIVSFSADNSKYPRSGILFSFKIRSVEGFKGGNVTVDNTVFTTTDFRDVPFAATTTWLDAEMQAGSITLSQTSAELKVGESVILTATVLPETATDKAVTWSSSDETIATVDAEGKVTALAIGETTITAICGSVSATCAVSVVATPAESITLSQTSAQLKAGESVTLTATVLPETTTDKTVTWSSSDETIATVDAEGKVTAITVGTATITATCGSVRAACTVSVVATPAESITLSQTSAQLKAGESVTLTVSVLPETATDKTVTW
ncbi:MAG: Ig-like domain-containing protein, partial [Prevotella sp.]|nr:Ig-like domain-containing protein [Prevotella sp.]